VTVALDSPRLTLGRFLEDVAAAGGDRCAIRFEGRSLGYAALEREVRRLSRALVGAGVVKGARVAVQMANRPEWVVAAFAVGRIGGVLVPVNTFAAPAERDHVLRHSDASLLLLQPALLKRRFRDELLADHPELGSGTPGRLRCPALPQLRRVACLGDASWDELLRLGDDVPDALVDALCAQVEPSDDALVIYTSGTTALPKGVVHRHRAPVLQSWRFAEILRLGPEDRLWTTYPFFWTAGICMSLGATLAAGATLVLQESFEPAAALDAIEAERATTVHAWPHQHKALGDEPSLARRDFSALRKIEITSPLAAQAGVRDDVYGTGASYGLSETFTVASMLPADAPAELRRRTHGPPLPGMEYRIVDPERGAPLPPGAPGEIAVRGVTLMRGYAKVLPELVLDADGWFRTQDGGSLDEAGHLHWTGRLSNLVKTGGANVSPVEIEQALARFEPLRVALAVGVPHPTLGEALVLCAVASEGAAPTEDAVRGFLRERLAAYKLPRRVLFFRPDELSYTGNQKIQVGPLREKALARLREEGAVIEGHPYR
jgi:acyl-CoA synthetase (AMP-forming)/AMP-acid ligase II